MTLKGIVDRIIFRNEENTYTVLSLNADDGGDYVCVGMLPVLDRGEYVCFEGDLKDNPKYGIQFSIDSFSISAMEDSGSALRYLSSGAIKGIGPGLAKRITAKFGDDTFRIMADEPERLSEIKGISLRKAIAISEAFEAKSGSRRAISFLSQYDISPNLGQKIYEKYKDRLYSVVKNNPYQLIEDIDGVGFKSADRIASAVGISPDSKYRIRSALLYILTETEGTGSLCVEEKELTAKAASVLSVSEDLIHMQIEDLSIERRIIREASDGRIFIFSERAYYAEAETARLLHDLNIPCHINPESVYKEVSRIEKEKGIELEDSQKEAVLCAVSNTLTVITGGPGTGKTTITNLVIDYYQKEGYKVTLAAPTGRAAKRMSETSGYEARTIHRLLGAGNMTEGGAFLGFEHDAGNPLETDVLILDEMSMVDIYVFRSLLRALVPGTRLILVGDADQLPSVGPGAVLRDIISSGCFHVTRLNRIYRQSEASAIVTNAHLIIEGRHLDLNRKTEDFFLIKRDNTEKIIQGIIYLAGTKLPAYLSCMSFEIQVMTPMRKGPLGVENLNMRLQEAFNPPDKRKREIAGANVVFRTGDKVMQTKNNYDIEWNMQEKNSGISESGTGVFNGDMGRIISVSHDALYVRFDDGREAVYKGENLSQLELAYAITIHKSQGSEYRAVILPLLSGPRMLMNRNLLYTAVTRAKRMVCIIGSAGIVEEMIDNENEEKRYTGLRRRLQEIENM